jgi:hypothetical protein
MTLIEAILSGDLATANKLVEARLAELIDEKIQQVKAEIAYGMFGEEELDEANVTKMGRQKLVRVRVRGGKVQRRKKVSAVQGYTFRGGKLTRMSTQERRHRKMAARKAKIKRRAKLKQALRKRKISLRKRHALGL